MGTVGVRSPTKAYVILRDAGCLGLEQLCQLLYRPNMRRRPRKALKAMDEKGPRLARF